MTREEAIKWLNRIEDKYIHGGDDDFDAKRKQAIAIAIEALKREDTMLKEIERAVLYGERGEANG